MTTTSFPEWTVLYHTGNPPFAGRAQPIRMLFTDAGVDFTETSEGLYGPDGYCDMFRGTGPNSKIFDKAAAQKQSAPFPVVAPPIIWHRPAAAQDDEVFINQLPAIMSFHPVDNAASYSTQQEEGDRVSKEWTERRMLIWLHSFEKVLEQRRQHELYVVGDKVTYADIALYWACDATQSQFDNEKYHFAWKHADVPLLKAFKNAFDERPNLKNWSTKVPYAGDSMM